MGPPPTAPTHGFQTRMTPRQIKLYRAELARVRSVLHERGGITSTEWEQHRARLHTRFLGYNKSSAAFTNPELDTVLRGLAGIHSPDDFDYQMRLLDSPDHRRTIYLGRCNTAMDVIGDGRDPEGYLATIAGSVQGRKEWPPRDEETLRKVMGIVETRAIRIRASRRKKHEAANPPPF